METPVPAIRVMWYWRVCTVRLKTQWGYFLEKGFFFWREANQLGYCSDGPRAHVVVMLLNYTWGIILDHPGCKISLAAGQLTEE